MLFYGTNNGQIDLVDSAMKVFMIADIYVPIAFATFENSETSIGASRQTIQMTTPMVASVGN